MKNLAHGFVWPARAPALGRHTATSSGLLWGAFKWLFLYPRFARIGAVGVTHRPELGMPPEQATTVSELANQVSPRSMC